MEMDFEIDRSIVAEVIADYIQEREGQLAAKARAIYTAFRDYRDSLLKDMGDLSLTPSTVTGHGREDAVLESLTDLYGDYTMSPSIQPSLSYDCVKTALLQASRAHAVVNTRCSQYKGVLFEAEVYSGIEKFPGAKFPEYINAAIDFAKSGKLPSQEAGAIIEVAARASFEAETRFVHLIRNSRQCNNDLVVPFSDLNWVRQTHYRQQVGTITNVLMQELCPGYAK